MTGKNHRLDRVTQTLSARERAVLVLRSWQEGRAEDPSWRMRMPVDQTDDFDYYLGLLKGVNERLFPLLLVLAQEADKLRLRLVLLVVLTLWHCEAVDGAWLLEHHGVADWREPHAPRRSVVYLEPELRRKIAEQTGDVEPNRLDELVEANKEALRESLRQHGGALLAVEAVLGEVREDFRGEDPLLPDTREAFEHAKQGLAEAREGAERYLGPVEEITFEEGQLERLRRLVGLSGHG